MSATITQLWRLSALDLAEAIRSGQVSSREVIEAHLRRIETVNPSVNAVTMVLGEQAFQAAKAADRAVAAGGGLPLLHGVPFTVKANIDLAGTPTTHGLTALAAADPGLDAPVVERLRAAGAIPVGRTNLSQLRDQLPQTTAGFLPAGSMPVWPQAATCTGPRLPPGGLGSLTHRNRA